MAPFALHTTGHWRLPEGQLLRVDVISGRWVVCLFDGPAVCNEAYGSDEYVHHVAKLWAHLPS